MNIRQSVCACWEDVATRLYFSPSLIDSIRKNNNEVEKAFDDTMKQWLNGTEGARAPIIWRTLLTVFREINRSVLAGELERILPEVPSSEN